MKRLAILTPVLALTLATVAQAGALAPRKPSEVVTLFTSGATCTGGGLSVDTQTLPDATTSAFAIPAGQVLVLTGIEWHFKDVGKANENIQLLLALGSGTGPTVFIDQALADSNGDAANKGAIANIVVKPATAICALLDPSATLRGARVHGFLTTDK